MVKCALQASRVDKERDGKSLWCLMRAKKALERGKECVSACASDYRNLRQISALLTHAVAHIRYASLAFIAASASASASTATLASFRFYCRCQL